MSQSIHASTPSSSGDRERAGRQPSPANLSSPLAAKRRHTTSWSSARMFTQNEPAASIWGQDDEPRSGKNATRGGSSDTEANEPTASPTGPVAGAAVMTVTPVGKWPST
jgi:hypothetical protein